ncbi:uncharacterized protein EI90DRAFT_3092181 [Cantharellus anzutake]|uniref:uncharacterized protein n=1 Tax=Cantharellus anzutake TaxID=1750568 RepID=UPI0019076AEF|nr:uncharacterized protein EI90DRAFT_3092181 [Cantharellus anzutake]KAF8313312.1 hypothetical protein EI90DRAFT_3092181 [Cantharellus anzutake]
MPNYICDAGTDAKVAKFQKRGLEVIRVGTWEPVEVWSSYRQRVSRTPSMAPSEEPGALERNATLLSGGNALSTDLFVRNSPSAFELPGPGKRSSINEKSPSVHLKDLPPPMQTSPPPSANPAKKLFGKMFKKNSRNGGDDDKSQPASPEPSSSEFSSRSKRFSARIGALSVPLSPQPSVFSGRSGHVSSSHSQPHEPILQPPVLGLQAALHSSHSAHPTGRPAHYIWCLRKWAKEKQLNPDSLLKALAVGFHGLNLNLLESHEKKHGKDSVDTSSTGDIEVRFEWSRGKSASSRGKERERQVMLNFKSPNPPRRSSFVENENGLLPPATGEDRNRDIETMSSTYSNHSRASLHSNVVQRSPKSAELGLTLTQGGDGGERSPSRRRSPTISRDDDTGMTDADDGEAKERALLQQQRRLSASDPNPSSGDDNDLPPLPTDGRIRFKLASLVPTPHHPKILGQFKLPFPLPDVAITPNASSSLSYLHSINSTASFSAPYSDSQTSPIPIALRRYESGVGARFLPRTLAPDGSIMRAADVTVSDGKEGGGVDVSTEVLLTAEDIKDVVSSTGLWLCVREGFGGLGRTKRKGDGWHIRA